jgi:hypothetical protein
MRRAFLLAVVACGHAPTHGVPRDIAEQAKPTCRSELRCDPPAEIAPCAERPPGVREVDEIGDLTVGSDVWARGSLAPAGAFGSFGFCLSGTVGEPDAGPDAVCSSCANDMSLYGKRSRKLIKGNDLGAGDQIVLDGIECTSDGEATCCPMGPLPAEVTVHGRAVAKDRLKDVVICR